jgi:hypothetical protein
MGEGPGRWLRRLALVLAACGLLSAQELKLVVPENLVPDLEAYLHGRRAEEIRTYASPQAKRAVIEHVILLQALYRAGVRTAVAYVPIGSYERQKAEIIQGHAFANGTFYWLDEFRGLQGDLAVLDPVLPSGHFVVGLYTDPGNRGALSVQDAQGLGRLAAVTSPAWSRDLAALQRLHLARIETTPIWSNMLRMVHGGRVDFTLMPFGPAPDMAVRTTEGFTLVPIPGFKVAIPGDRGVVVSRAYPGTATLAPRLGEALRAMVADGTVVRAFRETGFLDDPRIRDWSLLPSD